MREHQVILILAIIAWLILQGHTEALTIVEVNAQRVNCGDNAGTSCEILVDGDLVTRFPIGSADGEGALQSRTSTRTTAAGVGALYEYLYRLDLSRTAATQDVPCVDRLAIDFGPVVARIYGGAIAPAHVFVITSGGLGSIGLTTAEQVGHRIFVTFDVPVCAGASTYFFGATSAQPIVRAVQAHIRQSSPGSPVALGVGAAAPELPVAEPFAALRRAIHDLSARSFAVDPSVDATAIASLRSAMIARVDSAEAVVGTGDPESFGNPDAALVLLRDLQSKLDATAEAWVTDDPLTPELEPAELSDTIEQVIRFLRTPTE